MPMTYCKYGVCVSEVDLYDCTVMVDLYDCTVMIDLGDDGEDTTINENIEVFFGAMRPSPWPSWRLFTLFNK